MSQRGVIRKLRVRVTRTTMKKCRPIGSSLKLHACKHCRGRRRQISQLPHSNQKVVASVSLLESESATVRALSNSIRLNGPKHHPLIAIFLLMKRNRSNQHPYTARTIAKGILRDFHTALIKQFLGRGDAMPFFACTSLSIWFGADCKIQIGLNGKEWSRWEAQRMSKNRRKTIVKKDTKTSLLGPFKNGFQLCCRFANELLFV